VRNYVLVPYGKFQFQVKIFLCFFIFVQAAIVNSQTLEEVARLEKVLHSLGCELKKNI
jgi:hypothetical protein